MGIFLRIFALISLFAAPAFATGEGTVILLRGKVIRWSDGQAQPTNVQLQERIPSGNTVATGPRSFVKIIFADNSALNIGPDSRIRLDAPAGPGQAGVMTLQNGQVRAQVVKDPVMAGEESQQQENKLYIRTKTAAVGVRGTDFQLIYNRQNEATSLLTYEGSVAMTKVDENMPPEPRRLAEALRSDRTILVDAGRFSGAAADRAAVSLPVKVSPAQMDSLRANETMLPPEAPRAVESAGSPVPPGVDPRAFASSDSRFERPAPRSEGPPPEGFFDPTSGTYAPRAGGYVDVKTAIYIPPPPGSTFDPNTGVYNPPKLMGSFDTATGAYMPPPGVQLDPVQGFIAAPATTSPSGTAPVAPAVSPAALNNFIAPTSAGGAVSFDPALSGQTMARMPPPPPKPGNLPPPPRDPSVDDPFCPTCHSDNVNSFIPQFTPLNFQIIVQ